MSLGQPFEGDYPNLFKQLQDFLYGQFANGRRTILIIDEAQNLEPEALEHLRMFSNINADKFQIFQLILVGQPQLRDLLLAPSCTNLRSGFPPTSILGRWMSARSPIISPFGLQAVGSPSAAVYPEACVRIASASGGIPRMINMLCDTALVYGFANDKKVDFRSAS